MSKAGQLQDTLDSCLFGYDTPSGEVVPGVLAELGVSLTSEQRRVLEDRLFDAVYPMVHT